jgi:hypothetical protein
VSSSGIETTGKTFGKNDIQRLVVNNGITKNDPRASHQAGIGATPTFISSKDLRLIAPRRLKLVAIAYSLEMETGGEAYILAGRMNQTTAFDLLMDVRRIVGL